jgi:hypothetical protein
MTSLEQEVRRLAAETKGEWAEARRVLTRYLRSVEDVVDASDDEDVRQLKLEVRAMAINKEWAWNELVRAAKDGAEEAAEQARLVRRDSASRLKRLKRGCVSLRERVGRGYELTPGEFDEEPLPAATKGNKYRGMKPEVLGGAEPDEA